MEKSAPGSRLLTHGFHGINGLSIACLHVYFGFVGPMGFGLLKLCLTGSLPGTDFGVQETPPGVQGRLLLYCTSELASVAYQDRV